VRTAVFIGALAAAPTAALACGGLFCDAAQPVEQAAERILFAPDGDTMHMHVRIEYQGPPAEFGWLLPVPPDVQTAPSSEALFDLLDGAYAPRFAVSYEIVGECDDFGGGGAGGGGGEGGGGGSGSGVDVLSREAVGPYDQAILRASAVADLRRWLDENGYRIPDGGDERLEPYVDAGAAFVALKLLPGAGTGDILPLHLTFTSPRAAIPLRPTGVAALPDMGILVHVLGPYRAVPVNYLHVRINDAAIDWGSGGFNYPDVVAQAVDEAGGKAFATDFAGPHGGLFTPPILSGQLINEVEDMRTLGDLIASNRVRGLAFDADVARVLGQSVSLPGGEPPDFFLQCPECYDDVSRDEPFDGPAVARRLAEEVNPPREHLAALALSHPYLTRLSTSMSPDEMDEDPVFSFNPDLPAVDNQRTAILRVPCTDGGWVDEQAAVLVTPDGHRLRAPYGGIDGTITRRNGVTVRGIDTPGAAVVETMFEAGASDCEIDRRDELRARYAVDVPGGDPTPVPPGGEGGGDGCDATGGGPASIGALFALLAVRRRRRA
jgi:uncharacterized protein (TIGR03382 family)